MSIADRCAAVIPCLNEAATIPSIVSAGARFVAMVIVVDDGSTDGTSSAAELNGAIVLRHDRPRGKGVALDTGFRHARKLGYDWVIALDGHGQHSPEDIPEFLAMAERSRARLVVGNRMHDAATMPLVRRIVNRWMSRKLSAFCGKNWPDTQCGFRSVHLETWSTLRFRAEHFEIESELLVRFTAAGHDVEFVPVETRYAGERSKIRPIRDSIRWFKWWREINREFSFAELTPDLSSAIPVLPGK